MLATVIDTSSAAVTAGVVAFGDGGPRVLAERVTVNARGHAELLVPAIRDCLTEAGVTVAELGAVIAGTGPGPFTGLRVGLMTAAALADAAGLPRYGVCSLDAIAAAVTAAEASGSGPLLVAGDARRREIYWATYVGADRGEPAGVASPSAVVGHTSATRMVGAGARLYADVLDLPLLDQDYPTVAGLAGCAASRVLAQAPSEMLVPLYLRRPDAVEPSQSKKVGQ